MAKITFIEFNGTPHTVDIADGTSLMQAAVDHNIPGIDADCGGAITCGTCMVCLPDDWLDKVPARSASQVATLLLALAVPTTFAAEAMLDPVVVSGSRIEHRSFDLPAAVSALDRETLADGQARVNASEALAAVPGVVALNRQNYAQDLQISIRGFGARSAFGVRGVQLIADGIPATMPDGQGQAATFNLDAAERMEVLRGPYSALYGNHAGGVIQLFTADGRAPASMDASFLAGSYGTWKSDISTHGQADGVSYVLDTSRFATDGYRTHSAVTRDQALAKLSFSPNPDARLTLIGGGLWQHDTQDPLGVRLATWQADPRASEAVATQFNTRKSIDHVQGGARYEQRFGDDRVEFAAWSGTREVTQFLAFQSNGVVRFERDFSGLSLRWSRRSPLADGVLTTSAGIETGLSSDERTGYDNNFGVVGTLRRAETDRVRNLDPYAQLEWNRGDWTLTGGLRHSRVAFQVQDRYLANGNDSGRVDYAETTPLASVLYRIDPTLNAYISLARGFETPTLNEMFYSGGGGGFNFNLKPARSRNLEAGLKALLGEETRLDAALFRIETTDELVIDQSVGGRTSYRNAAGTLRQGAELALASRWSNGLATRLALTAMRAEYDAAFTTSSGSTIPAGNRLPGVPERNLFGELVWRAADGGLHAATELVARSHLYVEDSNQSAPAPGYAVLNLRAGLEQQRGPWRVAEFVRLDNLLDRKYIGSVIVGDTRQRFYEAAPGRAWLLGASLRYTFDR